MSLNIYVSKYIYIVYIDKQKDRQIDKTIYLTFISLSLSIYIYRERQRKTESEKENDI